jgi:hypothetical protein
MILWTGPQRTWSRIPLQRGLFGDDEDADQEEYGPEEDTGSFVEEDTVLGVPPRGGLGDEEEYGEEEGVSGRMKVSCFPRC